MSQSTALQTSAANVKVVGINSLVTLEFRYGNSGPNKTTYKITKNVFWAWVETSIRSFMATLLTGKKIDTVTEPWDEECPSESLMGKMLMGKEVYDHVDIPDGEGDVTHAIIIDIS